MLYIKFSITERKGDLELDHDMVAQIPDDTTVDQLTTALNSFLLDFYANSEWDDSDDPPYKVWTGNNSLCWISDDEQLQGGEEEFIILCQHMNNQTFNVNEYLTNPRFRL